MVRAVGLALVAALMVSACEQQGGVLAEIEAAEAKGAQAAQTNLAASEAFMAKKEAEGGWQKTPSGILYKFVRTNPADVPKPTEGSPFLAHYHGTLIDGSVFDSSYQRGIPFGAQQPAVVGQGVIEGWSEVLQLMKPGETIDTIIPPKLAYGDSRSGPGGPNQALQFRIELVAFASPTDRQVYGDADPSKPPKDPPEGVTPPGPPPPTAAPQKK